MKDKIPFYNIANMFFVGAVFAIANVLLFHECLSDMDLSSQLYMTLKDWSIVATAAIIVVVFEIGFILNRASSVLIAPILEKTKIWPKEKYNLDVSELSNKHPKFQSMITDLVLMRTHILMYLILAIESLFSPYKLASLVCLSIILVIVFSGRKHNARINIMRKSFAEKESEEKKHNQEFHNFLTYDGTPKKPGADSNQEVK
jgi:hypothetical protein